MNHRRQACGDSSSLRLPCFPFKEEQRRARYCPQPSSTPDGYMQHPSGVAHSTLAPVRASRLSGERERRFALPSDLEAGKENLPVMEYIRMAPAHHLTSIRRRPTGWLMAVESAFQCCRSMRKRGPNFSGERSTQSLRDAREGARFNELLCEKIVPQRHISHLICRFTATFWRGSALRNESPQNPAHPPADGCLDKQHGG